jgi:hypothetical protein
MGVCFLEYMWPRDGQEKGIRMFKALGERTVSEGRPHTARTHVHSVTSKFALRVLSCVHGEHTKRDS